MLAACSKPRAAARVCACLCGRPGVRVRATNATDASRCNAAGANPGPMQPRPQPRSQPRSHPVPIILPVPTTVSTTVQPTNNPTNQPTSRQAGANRCEPVRYVQERKANLRWFLVQNHFSPLHSQFAPSPNRYTALVTTALKHLPVAGEVSLSLSFQLCRSNISQLHWQLPGIVAPTWIGVTGCRFVRETI